MVIGLTDFRMAVRGENQFDLREMLNLAGMLLVPEQDKIGTAADAEFRQDIGNMELNGAFGDIQLGGNLLVRQVLQQLIEHFRLART